MCRYTQFTLIYLSLFWNISSGSFLRMERQAHGPISRHRFSIKPSIAEGNLEIRVLESPVHKSHSPTSSIRFARRQHTQSNRYVFAHVVQGNFQSYQADDWRADMELAKASGIDAFAINIGRDVSNAKQLPLAYDVADNVGFSLFLSIDMVYYGQADSSSDVARLIRAYSDRKSQFRYEGKTLVSTFSGEVAGTYLDNNPNFNAAWNSLKEKLGFPIYFMPAWTGAQPSAITAADGLLSWDAWSSASSSPDEKNRRAFAAVGKQYGAPISPLFFKHLDHGESGNYIYSSDDMLVIDRYLQLVRSPPTFIELLTWNDYGESHYLRDPRPNANLPKAVVSAHDYVDGFTHEPLLDMLSYFNFWYKKGDRPKLEKSKLYMWYRPHPKTASASDDPLSKPKSADQTQDKIYILLIIKNTIDGTEVEKISITSGLETHSTNLRSYLSSKSSSSSSSSSGGGGGSAGDSLIRISVPFNIGQRQSVEIFGNHGQKITNLIGIPILDNPKKYNFNYWSGMVTF